MQWGLWRGPEHILAQRAAIHSSWDPVMGFPVSASPLFGGRPGASVVLQLLMSGGVSHFSFIHQELERSMVKRSVPVHTDVQKAQMKRDDHAVNAMVGWLEQVNPFDARRDKNTLVSFSTGFSSTPGDQVNADQAEEVGRAMQARMDGKTVLDPLETKHKVKSLANLRSGPKVNGEKLVIDSLKLFNRLIII